IITSPCQSDPSLCNQPFSYCVNSSDISTCSCYPGFDKILRDDSSAFHCEDINECTSQDLVCHLDAVCENTEGSFECR
ncbi:hypothetical protein GN156_39125, partial [bacterium LRH843]|nr:hypothetical protein [bacterium LRH843]